MAVTDGASPIRPAMVEDSSPATAASGAGRGAMLVALLSIASYAGMDALMKGLSIQMGPYVALLWRSLFALILVLPIVVVRGLRWPGRTAALLHLVRGTASTLLALAFFWGLARVPLAQGVAVSFVSPVLAILIAAAALGERISPYALAGAVVSLAGVVTIAAYGVRSTGSAEIAWGMAAIVAGAVLYAVNIVLLRVQSRSGRPDEIAFWSTSVTTIELALFGSKLLFLPTGAQAGMLLLAAVFTVLSLLGLAWAYSRSQAQHVVTSEYTGLIWAGILGYIFFGEGIAAATIVGSLMIIAGCYIATRLPRRLSPRHSSCAG